MKKPPTHNKFECVLRPVLASNKHGMQWTLVPMSDFELDPDKDYFGWEPSIKAAIKAATKTAGKGNIAFYRIGKREDASKSKPGG